MEQAANQIRSPAEVARRALALQAVVGVAMGADRQTVLKWLSENQLWEALSPSEAGFLDTPEPSPKQKINASWLSERLIVLTWALELTPRLPKPDEQCDAAMFTTVIPPFATASVQEFIEDATLKPEGQLRALANEILDLHAEARSAKRDSRSPKKPVDLEIIQERHHAINWITGYDGLDWDQVTADT